jgi:hypothetical protein
LCYIFINIFTGNVITKLSTERYFNAE